MIKLALFKDCFQSGCEMRDFSPSGQSFCSGGAGVDTTFLLYNDLLPKLMDSGVTAINKIFYMLQGNPLSPKYGTQINPQSGPLLTNHKQYRILRSKEA